MKSNKFFKALLMTLILSLGYNYFNKNQFKPKKEISLLNEKLRKREEFLDDSAYGRCFYFTKAFSKYFCFGQNILVDPSKNYEDLKKFYLEKDSLINEINFKLDSLEEKLLW